MRRTTKTILFLLLAGLLLAACGAGEEPDAPALPLGEAQPETLLAYGTDVGNPTATPGWLFSVLLARAPSRPVLGPKARGASADEGAPPGPVSEARLHLSRVRLVLEPGTKCRDYEDHLAGGAYCQGSRNVHIPGPVVFDLVTGETVPDLSGVRVPAAPYSWADLQLCSADPVVGYVGADDPLAHKSLAAITTTEVEGEPADLDLRLRIDSALRVTDVTTAELEDGVALRLGLDGSGWLEDTGVEGCVASGALPQEGDLWVVDDTPPMACPDVVAAIEREVLRSGAARGAH